ENAYAVVLLDVQMHGVDGCETAKRIRSQERIRHTPIIFLTAYDADRPTIEQAYALGAVDFLVKPLMPVVLRAKVAGFVELFKKTQQIEHQAAQVWQFERHVGQMVRMVDDLLDVSRISRGKIELRRG